MVHDKKSEAEISSEMEKCDLLCARCHHLKTVSNGEAGYHAQGRKRKFDEYTKK